jgi:uncharacterized protein (TIGR02099 family)
MGMRKIGKILLYSIAGLILAVLLLMLAVKLALDRAPQYQAEIKNWVHAQTGYHIGFAHVSPAFRWYGPELYFDRLELRSKDDQRVLARASGGRVAADIWQLLRSGKLLAGRIEVDAPNIVVTRLGPNRFAVAEIELGGEDPASSELKMNDLPAGRIVIRHAVLTLQNWNAALPLLAMQNVNLDLQRDADELGIDFSAQLPAVLGGSLTFKANAKGSGELSKTSWNAAAHARDISFPGWRQLLPEYLSNLDSGTGSFELAAVGQGQVLARADLEFGAANVVTQLAEGPVARFDQMSGGLAVIHTGDRWTVTGKRVRVGRADPESSFDFSWHEVEAGLLDFRAHASYLRAETLLPLTGFLPQKDLRERLRQIAPTGEWTDTLVALMRDKVDAPWRLQVAAKFRRAGYAPFDGAPGVRGLAGSISGNESGGHIFIDTNSAVFNWPTQFSKPVDLEGLKSNLYWQRTDQELLIATPAWHVKTRDAELSGQMAWHQPADGSSPVVTLLSTIQNGNVVNARNYLPKALLAPSAYAWLERAFLAGRMTHAHVLLQGPIRHFPFRDGSGIFLARCALEGMALSYSEGWPAAENLAVTAEFRNEGMSARLSAGHLAGIALESGEAHFPDFDTGELKIHAALRGEADEALTFLRATPLDESAGHAFSSVEATGALRAAVDLFLPFKDFSHRQVLIHGHLDQATLKRTNSTTMATDVSGDFDIDGGQVAHADIHGQLLGGPFQMQARAPRSRPLTRTQLEIRGTVSGDALRAVLSLPTAAILQGQTDWRAVVKISPEPTRERSLRITSNLLGLELKLPAPLDKPASIALPISFEIQWPAAGGAQATLALGNVLSSSFALEADPVGMHLARGAVMFGGGELAASEAQMLNIGGTVQRLDLAGWLKLGAPDKDSKPLSYYLHSAKVEVAELDYLGLAFRGVSLDLAIGELSWRITVGGPNVVGTLIVPSAVGSAEPWSLQFERLRFDVPDTDESADRNGPGSVADPRAIPSINFHAAELVWGERQFGDVKATLVKTEDGVSLPSLAAAGPNFEVSAQGEWRGKGAGTSRIQGTLSSTDVQGTLKDLGYAEVIQARSGKMEFDLSWPGAPSGEAIAQAAGHVKLSMEKGQIIGLKPGAGRVLGLASIAALPRRLALDFSDLTDKGLAFDTVHGDFDLREGNAYTENVLLKGPAAEIGLIGRVGLKNKDYDQTAVVTGSVGNSLSIPLASALVGGPVVGAAVLLFTQVFKQPLKGLARGYYRITGSWDNPTVERIKSADAAQATAEAPK